jgi:hypothetical protein
MADTETCITALQEIDHYRWKQGSFSKDLAEKMTYDSNTSLGMTIICALDYLTDYVVHFVLFHVVAQWWAMFGEDTPNLQKLALRLVSQCCSSSRCERNWSIFALIHTKVHNKLSYKKLHKFVYVNYNLHIRL